LCIVNASTDTLNLLQAVNLSTSLGCEVISSEIIGIRSLSNSFLGSGQVQSLADRVEASKANCVFINSFLSAVQHKQLQQELKCEGLFAAYYYYYYYYFLKKTKTNQNQQNTFS
jgi:50S ribosomal subunit-associated GTPase HflX